MQDKDFLIRKGSKVYCSKCGKMLMQDRFQYKKHEQECGTHFYNLDNPLKEKNCYGYTVQNDSGKLIFRGYNLVLTNNRGFTDKFCGSEWKEIYHAIFCRDSREFKEEGQFSSDIWFKRFIDLNKIPILSKESPSRVISEVFPCIPYIHDFGMFLDMYRQKGYHVADIDMNALDRDMKRREPLTESIDHRSSSLASIVSIGSEILIRLDFPDSGGKIYIGKDIVSVSEEASEIYQKYINREMGKNILFKNINGETTPNADNDVIKIFSRRYPEYMIDKYIEGGGCNPISFILSFNINKNKELAGKAGLGFFCDYYELFEHLCPYSNKLQDIFGMPLRALRCLNSYQGMEFLVSFMNTRGSFVYQKTHKILLETKQDIICFFYRIVPEAFDGIFNVTQLQFMEKIVEQPIVLNKLSPKNIARIMKNMRYNRGYNNLSSKIHVQYYIDYLMMCHQIGEYVCGLCPKDVISAHNQASETWKINRNQILNDEFIKIVTEPDYLSLESCEQEDKKQEEIPDYIIIAPRKPDDLINESVKLHHCVKTYVPMVAGGFTKIYFLRERDKPDIPFATIEVNCHNCLTQLKAICNHKAPRSAIDFVKRWAEEKDLKISSPDI